MTARCEICGAAARFVSVRARGAEWPAFLCREHRGRIWLWYILHERLGTFRSAGNKR